MAGRGVDLGADIAALVRACDVPLMAATALSARGEPEARWTTFRLRFADGQVCKAVRLSTPAHAEVVHALSRRLSLFGVPPVLARSGCALLVPWIEGRALDSLPCTPHLARRCGALQGRVHSRRLEESDGRRTHDAVERWHRALADGLETLVRAGVLGERDAERAHRAARRYAPRRWRRGFMLGDFCAENVVLRRSGELCVIDNETLEIGPCDYDLARTWYRWPMSRRARAAYLDGYAQHRSPRQCIAHFPYWAIAALVHGALFRQRMRQATAAVPLQRLRVLLRDLERGDSPADLIYGS